LLCWGKVIDCVADDGKTPEDPKAAAKGGASAAPAKGGAGAAAAPAKGGAAQAAAKPAAKPPAKK